MERRGWTIEERVAKKGIGIKSAHVKRGRSGDEGGEGEGLEKEEKDEDEEEEKDNNEISNSIKLEVG